MDKYNTIKHYCWDTAICTRGCYGRSLWATSSPCPGRNAFPQQPNPFIVVFSKCLLIYLTVHHFTFRWSNNGVVSCIWCRSSNVVCQKALIRNQLTKITVNPCVKSREIYSYFRATKNAFDLYVDRQINGRFSDRIIDITKMDIQIKPTICFSCLCFNIVLPEQLHFNKLQI